MSGAWVAYYYDMSAVVIFAEEIDALRHAQQNQMALKFVKFGESL